VRSYSTLALSRKDRVLTITLNRPEVLNAVNLEMHDELADAFNFATADTESDIVVLTGAGRAFCAGQDLHDVADTQPLLNAQAVQDVVTDIQRITRAITTSIKPSVCAINGPAVGFGLEVTLGCDLRLAAPEAYFMLPELSRGLFHTNGTYHFLPPLAGPGLAADMILTGRRVSAEEAAASGLVSRVVPAAELLSTAVTVARQLGALAPRPLALARRALRSAELRADLEAALTFEASACLQLLVGAEPSS